jgi:hypothetical protein
MATWCLLFIFKYVLGIKGVVISKSWELRKCRGKRVHDVCQSLVTAIGVLGENVQIQMTGNPLVSSSYCFCKVSDCVQAH